LRNKLKNVRAPLVLMLIAAVFPRPLPGGDATNMFTM